APLVSVVMAVRNGERWLGAAMDSVVAQTHRPVEIVVVDGGSSDGTAALAARYPEARVVSQRGTGIADAYNQGIAEARGELVAFLSHDDLWRPEKLAKQVALLRHQPELDLTVTRVRFFLEEGATPPPGFRPALLQGD